jgi:hypothetical protein
MYQGRQWRILVLATGMHATFVLVITLIFLLAEMQDANEFEWQMQLRYYFENEDVVVRQVGSRG